MEKLRVLLFSIFCTLTTTLHAQWLTNGNNVYYNTGNVGIGTTNPISKLQVIGQSRFVQDQSGLLFQDWSGAASLYLDGSDGDFVGSDYVIFKHDGSSFHIYNHGSVGLTMLSNRNIGIGTTNPGGYKLNIQAGSSQTLIQSSSDAPLSIRGTDTWSGIGFDDIDSDGYEYIWYRGSSGTFSIGGGGSNVAGKKLHIEGGTTIGVGYRSSSVTTNGLAVQGNVGIGTTNPTAKLAVNGITKTKEIIVTEQASDWPDYVFSDAGYRLPDLRELEAFIKKHKHLPGIPTKEEVEQNGQNLGVIQARLLEKIEKLTLHMIDQQKKNKIPRRGSQKI